MVHVIMLDREVVQGAVLIMRIPCLTERKKREGIMLQGLHVVETPAIGICQPGMDETPE